MSHELAIVRRLRVLATLEEVVDGLRSLSAQHFRAARRVLEAARRYRDEIERTLPVLPALLGPPPAASPAPPALLVVGSDLGLCGDFTSRIVREARAGHAALRPARVYCLGRRAAARLAAGGIALDEALPAPASVAGLAGTLLPLVNTILAERRAGRIGGLELVAARFQGAGAFRVERVRVLPVSPPADGRARLHPSPWTGPEHLARVVVREYLYVALHETLLDAQAAEHGKRLVVAQAARSWLEEQTGIQQRRLTALRRENATQQVLEVAAGGRSLRGESAWGTRA